MHRNASFFLLAILLLCISACKKDAFESIGLPLVHTGTIKQVSKTGVILHAKVVELGNSPIINHGFVWSIMGNPTIEASVEYLGSLNSKGVFSAEVNSDIFKEKRYFVRAFVQIEDRVVYGSQVSFEGQGSSPPQIEGFSPLEGISGTEVTITGQNFSEKAKNNHVRFGDMKADVISASEKELKVVVPKGFRVAKMVHILVIVAGLADTSSNQFFLSGPRIESFTPTSAIEGSPITLRGKNFSENAFANSVRFGTAQASVQQASTTELIVSVPRTNYAGEVYISLTVNGVRTVAQEPFIIEGPEITHFTPTEGIGGTLLKVYGKNFSPIASENRVRIQSKNVVVNLASTDSLYVTVPYSIEPTLNPDFPNNRLELTVTRKTVLSENPFRVLSHWTLTSPIPAAKRSEALGFVIGSQGYFGLGFNQQDWWMYSPLSNSWSRRANFPGVSRIYGISMAANGIGYVGGGGQNLSNIYKDFWAYNPSTNQWTQLMDMPAQGRAEAVGLSVDGRLYAGLGRAGGNTELLADFWEYDIAQNQWIQKSDFPGGARRDAVAFSINGKAYVGMGYRSNNTSATDLWQYDPQSNQWIRKADTPVNSTRFRSAVFVLNGKAYITGTFSNSGSSSRGAEIWIYDPATNSWQRTADMIYLSPNGSIASTWQENASLGWSIDGFGYMVNPFRSFTNTNHLVQYDPDL